MKDLNQSLSQDILHNLSFQGLRRCYILKSERGAPPAAVAWASWASWAAEHHWALSVGLVNIYITMERSTMLWLGKVWKLTKFQWPFSNMFNSYETLPWFTRFNRTDSIPEKSSYGPCHLVIAASSKVFPFVSGKHVAAKGILDDCAWDPGSTWKSIYAWG